MPVGTPDYIAPEVLQSLDEDTNMPYGVSKFRLTQDCCFFFNLVLETPNAVKLHA